MRQLEHHEPQGTFLAATWIVLELQPTLLRRAVEIAGGTDELCQLLGVSETRLRLWLSASVRLPDPVFLKAVDLILRDDIARATHDRRVRPRVDGAARKVGAMEGNRNLAR